MEGDQHQLRVLRIIYGEQSWSWIVDRRAGGGGPSSSRLSINPDPDPPRLRERQRGCSPHHCVTSHGTMAAADN